MLQIYQRLPQAAYRAQKKIIKVYKGNHKHGMYQNHRTVGAFYGELCKKSIIKGKFRQERKLWGRNGGHLSLVCAIFSRGWKMVNE